MCGLAGIAGAKLTWNDLKYFQTLLSASVVRGFDSTGVMIYSEKNNQYDIEKSLEVAPQYVDRRKKYLTDFDATAMMGHTRWSTVGVRNVANAHPFDTDKFVAAHNGSLVDAAYHQKGKTDSELMFRDMDVRGIKTVLEGLDYFSAYAVSIFEKRTQNLIFARNDERPLYFSVHPDRPVFSWGSDLGLMEYAEKKADLKSMKKFFVKPGYIYTVDIKNIKADSMPWSTEAIIEPKKPKVSTRMDDLAFAFSDIDWSEEALYAEFLLDRYKFARNYPNLVDHKGDYVHMNIVSPMNDRIPF